MDRCKQKKLDAFSASSLNIGPAALRQSHVVKPGCSAAVERTPGEQEDVGLNPTLLWVFFLLFLFPTPLYSEKCL